MGGDEDVDATESRGVSFPRISRLIPNTHRRYVGSEKGQLRLERATTVLVSDSSDGDEEK
jgi:hypothetical protein